MVPRILPGYRSRRFDHRRGVRQRKAESDGAAFLAGRAAETDRHPALAQTRDRDLLAVSVLKAEICCDLHLQAHGPAALSFHESPGGAKTRFRFFGRDGLENN